MVRRYCDITDARRLLNPGPVTLVTTSWRANTNVAPIAWTVPLSMNPPLIGVVIHPNRHTSTMIRFSEEFALNIPGPALLRQTAFFASQGGLDTKKLEASGLQTFNAMRVEAPLLEDCLAWIECGLQDVIPVGDHTMFVGRVVTVQAMDEAYGGTWLLESPETSPLVYLGGTKYATLASPREAVFSVDVMGHLEAETAEERERREEEEAQQLDRDELEGVPGITVE